MYETREEREALFNFTGKYTEVELLNKEASGFGWAVLVKDNYENHRLKVVKLPNREAATRELLAEAGILAKIAQYLRHPNLIALGSVDRYLIDWHGKREERWFIVLEYGGISLRQRLGRLGMIRRGEHEEFVYANGFPLSVEEVLRLGLQAADGLRALHEFEEAPGQHIIHRDIKPENILLADDGTLRLTDFGISKVVERLTQSVSVAGTLPYLAPEYSRGRIGAASDIYSLGIVLYEMATGRFPFVKRDDRFYQMPPPPHTVNPALPTSLSDVIQRALWWDPMAARGEEASQRYQRSAELFRDLQRCQGRLFPVPRRFARRTGTGADNQYVDTETKRDVRIFLYETAAPGPCRLRLGLTAGLADPHVLSPLQVLEPEGMIGVVVPAPPGEATPPAPAEMPEQITSFLPTVLPESFNRPTPSSAGLPARERVADAAIPEWVKRLIVLCRQLDRLYRVGVHHGLLTSYSAHWERDAWILDHVWLGALTGLVSAEQALRGSGVAVGYLAPEVLRWESAPGLAADIYGVGALLHGLLTGGPPIAPADAWAATRGTPPPAPALATLPERAPGATRRLREILAKALQPDPTRRQRSLDELERELSACRWPDDVVAGCVEDAREYHRQGKLVEAYDALDRAQRLDPGSPTVHFVRAEIYFREGEFKWALKENQKALSVEETAAGCQLHARCLLALGRCEEALELAKLALEKEDSADARELLARCQGRST